MNNGSIAHGLSIACAILLSIGVSPAAGETPAPKMKVMESDANAEVVLPRVVVERFQAALIEAMQGGDELGYEGRFELLAPPVRASHDFRTVVRVAVGRYWSRFDEDQRSELIERFGRLSISTYAAQFDHFSGERFETVAEETVGADRGRVQSLMHRPGEDDVAFEYLLQRDDGRWRIVNIIADGVSDLAIKRAEYNRILADRGLDGLLADIDAKIADNEKPM